MTASTTLPHILNRPAVRRLPTDIEHVNAQQMTAPARFWLGKGKGQLPRDARREALREALQDDAVAARIAETLRDQDRQVLAAYLRYGGVVNGAVIRLDLLARGLLEVEETGSSGYSWQRWKRYPIQHLAGVWALLPPDQARDRYSSYYGQEVYRAFPLYGVQAGLAKAIPAARPPPWSVDAGRGVPESTGRRSPAQVTLDLARVCAFVASRNNLKATRDGQLLSSQQRALAKAVPLDQGDTFPLPDPQMLYFELLRYNGLVRVEDGYMTADQARANEFFTQPAAEQVHAWARCWLWSRSWYDGSGAEAERHSWGEEESVTLSLRQILSWALACLAQANEGWLNLHTFLTALRALQGRQQFYGGFSTTSGWDPKWPFSRNRNQDDESTRERAIWFDSQGRWYANALLVTLVELGLVERGRVQRTAFPECFRLTPWGRAVFGAPEVAPPPAEESQPFLLVQPNFDVLAYSTAPASPPWRLWPGWST
jgi:hypothetical protein